MPTVIKHPPYSQGQNAGDTLTINKVSDCMDFCIDITDEFVADPNSLSFPITEHPISLSSSIDDNAVIILIDHEEQFNALFKDYVLTINGINFRYAPIGTPLPTDTFTDKYFTLTTNDYTQAVANFRDELFTTIALYGQNNPTKNFFNSYDSNTGELINSNDFSLCSLGNFSLSIESREDIVNTYEEFIPNTTYNFQTTITNNGKLIEVDWGTDGELGGNSTVILDIVEELDSLTSQDLLNLGDYSDYILKWGVQIHPPQGNSFIYCDNLVSPIVCTETSLEVCMNSNMVKDLLQSTILNCADYSYSSEGILYNDNNESNIVTFSIFYQLFKKGECGYEEVSSVEVLPQVSILNCTEQPFGDSSSIEYISFNQSSNLFINSINLMGASINSKLCLDVHSPIFVNAFIRLDNAAVSNTKLLWSVDYYYKNQVVYQQPITEDIINDLPNTQVNNLVFLFDEDYLTTHSIPLTHKDFDKVEIQLYFQTDYSPTNAPPTTSPITLIGEPFTLTFGSKCCGEVIYFLDDCGVYNQLPVDCVLERGLNVTGKEICLDIPCGTNNHSSGYGYRGKQLVNIQAEETFTYETKSYQKTQELLNYFIQFKKSGSWFIKDGEENGTPCFRPIIINPSNLKIYEKNKRIKVKFTGKYTNKLNTLRNGL